MYDCLRLTTASGPGGDRNVTLHGSALELDMPSKQQTGLHNVMSAPRMPLMHITR